MNTIETLTVPDDTVEGLTYRFDIVSDFESIPSDDESITSAQRAAWHADAWQYVGVIVTPIIADCDLDFASDALWGLEYGTFTDTDKEDTVTGIREITAKTLAHEYPGPDLITGMRGTLADKLAPIVAALESARANLDAANSTTDKE